MEIYSFRFISDASGEILIGSFRENFQTNFSYWPRDRYETQWHEAKEMLSQGKDSAFVTSITKPEDSNFLRWWLCYRQGDEIIFQEHVLFIEDLDFQFNENNIYAHIPIYESVTEDGDKISEWRISTKKKTTK